MSDKRLVHDILSESQTLPDGTKMQRRPVSFIQHGNREDGNTYEAICPWCGDTLGYIPGETVRAAIGGLYRCLVTLQKIHWTSCKNFPKITQTGRQEFAVEITTKPLNVEKPFVVN